MKTERKFCLEITISPLEEGQNNGKKAENSASENVKSEL